MSDENKTEQVEATTTENVEVETGLCRTTSIKTSLILIR